MTIESIVRGINRELVPVFEERLRAALADKDRAWLVDQVVRLTLDAHALSEADQSGSREAALVSFVGRVGASEADALRKALAELEAVHPGPEST